MFSLGVVIRSVTQHNARRAPTGSARRGHTVVAVVTLTRITGYVLASADVIIDTGRDRGGRKPKATFS